VTRVPFHGENPVDLDRPNNEATCREITHFGKSGIANSGVLVTRVRDFPWWKPQDRSGPPDLGRPRVIRLPISGNRGSGIREFR
jgi:hypothetical protein